MDVGHGSGCGALRNLNREGLGCSAYGSLVGERASLMNMKQEKLPKYSPNDINVVFLTFLCYTFVYKRATQKQ